MSCPTSALRSLCHRQLIYFNSISPWLIMCWAFVFFTFTAVCVNGGLCQFQLCWMYLLLIVHYTNVGVTWLFVILCYCFYWHCAARVVAHSPNRWGEIFKLTCSYANTTLLATLTRAQLLLGWPTHGAKSICLEVKVIELNYVSILRHEMPHVIFHSLDLE